MVHVHHSAVRVQTERAAQMGDAVLKQAFGKSLVVHTVFLLTVPVERAMIIV